jgi:cystathionine beta-lyase/cystathionine gamma-synthase
MSDYRFETQAIHAGQEPDPSTGAIMTPIYQTSTYVQSKPGDHKGFEYSRTDNPTRQPLEKLVAALEGGQHGVAFASGMAAIDTLLRLFDPGDHVVVGNDVYGGTFRLFDKVLARYGLTFSFVDTSHLPAVQAALKDETKLVWLETPTNPLLRLADIQSIVQLLPAGVKVAVDNTFASPYLQQPLAMGADMVVHSTTKYLGGHSDVVGGMIVLDDKDDYERLKFLQNAVGAVPGPMDCWLTLRGIKTLHLRMERHSANALKIAEFLADHPAFEQVIYPGLPSHPQHELAKQMMPKGFGGMISATMQAGEAAAREFVSHTNVFALAESLGGVESLIEHPYSMTHGSTIGSTLEVPASLIRLSVGIEHVDDLIGDLEQALAKI